MKINAFVKPAKAFFIFVKNFYNFFWHNYKILIILVSE
jgi:hypothetical protein